MSPSFVDNDGNLNWRKVGYHARSAFAVLLSLAVLVGGGIFVYHKAEEAWVTWRTEDDFIGDGTVKTTVVVPSGASVTQIGDMLVEAGVIKSTATFRKEANRNIDAANLQAGRYTLRKELPAGKALEMMLNPDNLVVIRVTLPEGLTVVRQWQLLSESLGKDGIEISVDQLTAAMKAKELNLPAWSRGKTEGFMFPDTYQVGEPVNPLSLYQTQVARFTAVTNEIGFTQGAEALEMDPFDVVTIASIIEREVNKEEYRPMVSAVIQNRLDEGMPLQMDSTVHYALQDFSKVTTTEEDRAVDSVYNTYINKGLPPGAISNPGKAALEAASKPADIDSLFFVTVDLDTGETRFADTLEEHEANVAVFQEWCAANAGRC